MEGRKLFFKKVFPPPQNNWKGVTGGNALFQRRYSFFMMLFTGKKCKRCGGDIFLVETYDLDDCEEFSCLQCGNLYWEDREVESSSHRAEDENVEGLGEVKPELIPPSTHSSIISAKKGSNRGSGRKVKRFKKFNFYRCYWR